MLEGISISFAYGLLKDSWRVVRGRRRHLTPAQVMDLRTKWKGEFESVIRERQAKRLGLDVIIRDMHRVDNYPHVTPKQGISPWFRAGLMDTYMRGIQLGLNWHTIKIGLDGCWRKADYDEDGAIKVILMGFVPFDNIHTVQWDGDEYYGKAHIYCYFDGRAGGPYENLSFCEERRINDHPYYTEIAKYKNVIGFRRSLAERLRQHFDRKR